MKVLKKVTVMALILMLIAGLFPARSAQAATKPAKAKVTVKANDDGTSVTLTIAKTKKAQGYQIMVKKPGAKKFTKLAAISEDGTAKRTYTAEKLTEGEYQFKVRAYLKNGKKTVWGKYSKVAKVKVNKAEDPKDEESGSENVKYISTLAELQAIDASNDQIKYVLKNDIDMTGWKKPIRNMYCSFDGGGHTLKNLSVPFVDYLSGGNIENVIFNLCFTDAYDREYGNYLFMSPINQISCGRDSKDYSLVKNCKATGTIKIKNEGRYTVDNYNSRYILAGGIVGYQMYGVIEKCVNEATISVSSGEFTNFAIGGIVAISSCDSKDGAVKECLNAGNINAEAKFMFYGVGGIVGRGEFGSRSKNCLNTGKISATDGSIGHGAGLTGAGSQTLENCVSLGSADFGVYGYAVDQTLSNSWNSSEYFKNVYFSAKIDDGFWWPDEETGEIKGVNKVSDITDKSAFKGLDFDKIWEMTENGPMLRNIPK